MICGDAMRAGLLLVAHSAHGHAEDGVSIAPIGDGVDAEGAEAADATAPLGLEEEELPKEAVDVPAQGENMEAAVDVACR